MTKAGQKMIEGAKAALACVKCPHDWQTVSLRVKDQKVVGKVCVCANCGTRRTEFVREA